MNEELVSHTAFTNFDYAISLCLVSQIQAYLTLTGRVNPKNDLSELIEGLGEHIKFLFDENQAMELFFLSRASKYLGVVKLGSKDIWKYLKTRFMKLSGAATPEQLLQFIEGVKKRGEKLSSYGSFVDLIKDTE